MTGPGCVFCAIVAGQEPAQVLQEWPDALAITPLNPVTPGHRLVLPKVHVTDACAHPSTTGAVALRAAEIATQGEHLAANIGPGAGMTVPHLHLHVWPCRGGGACMPWGCP